MGFGANSRLHTTKILRLSEDLPMIIEIVDAKEKIDELMPHIDQMVQEGFVTLEPVQVIQYRANQSTPSLERSKPAAQARFVNYATSFAPSPRFLREPKRP